MAFHMSALAVSFSIDQDYWECGSDVFIIQRESKLNITIIKTNREKTVLFVTINNE